MDVLLVSGRSADARVPPPSRARAAALGQALASRGHRVRWLCPIAAAADALAAPDGVELETVASAVPPFLAVQGRCADAATERALGLAVRARLPDVVHALTLGGVSSAMTCWIAQHLGAPSLADVSPTELLCHRGTLVDERGAPCRAWADPDRCVACTSAPWQHGLTERQARRARGIPWRWRWCAAWSPYPKRFDFESRLDVAVGGCQAASLITVPDQAAAQDLVDFGVVARRIAVVEPADYDAARAEQLYARARAEPDPAG